MSKNMKKPQSFREWLAMRLVRLAQWIYPKSEAVLSFYAQMAIDEMVYGQHITRIDPRDIYMEKSK